MDLQLFLHIEHYNITRSTCLTHINMPVLCHAAILWKQLKIWHCSYNKFEGVAYFSAVNSFASQICCVVLHLL